MRQEFGWQGKTTHRAADWSAPEPEQRSHGAWHYLPLALLIGLAVGLAASAALAADDRAARDRVLAAAGFTADAAPR